MKENRLKPGRFQPQNEGDGCSGKSGVTRYEGRSAKVSVTLNPGSLSRSTTVPPWS